MRQMSTLSTAELLSVTNKNIIWWKGNSWKKHFATSKKWKSLRGVWMDCSKRWCKLSHNPPEMNKWRIITFWSLSCLSRDVKSTEYSFEWRIENTEVRSLSASQTLCRKIYSNDRFAVLIVPPLFIKYEYFVEFVINFSWFETTKSKEIILVLIL